ncbi:MAG TPA: Hsp20/alpha crystallin family protein [Streptosporangiaceae bacterium]|jgi:HSP20 family molecular chaperone IbpA|nr:Hsp20/alpha crystallin family protein [Streptosporangiaceae bacterium]
MAALARRTSSARFPDLFDWLESPLASLLPFAWAQTFRVEDYTEDGNYVVRAELPGLNPQKDIEVTVDAGILTIHAERPEERKDTHHSEFRYGPVTRSVTLPADTDAAKVTASYDQGILEVSVPAPDSAKPERRVAIHGRANRPSAGQAM